MKLRASFKLPIVKIAKLVLRYKTGGLTFLAFTIALILLIVSSLACTLPGIEQCEDFSRILEQL